MGECGMQRVEEFKDFVRKNMYLKTAVSRRMITWQKAYELYDLFGEGASEFEEIRIALEPPPEVEQAQAQQTTVNTSAAANSTYDILNILSTIDYNKVGNTVDQLQKILGVVKDFTKPEAVPDTKSRRVFKRFND